MSKLFRTPAEFFFKLAFFAMIARFYLHEQIIKNNTVRHAAPMGAMRSVPTIFIGTIEDSSWMT
jgi:hypothetical protein